MQKILERQHASHVPDNERTPTPGKVWYLPHLDVYHPKKPDQVRVVFDCRALYNSQSLNKNVLQGPDQLNSLIGVLTSFSKEDVALTCDMKQMFHSFHITTSHRDFLHFLWFENNDLDGAISEFRMNVHLFGAVSSPAATIVFTRQQKLDVPSSVTRQLIFCADTFMWMTALLRSQLFQKP